MIDLLSAAGVPEAVHAARSTFGKEDRQRSSIYTTVETILEPFAEVADEPDAGTPDEVDPRVLTEGQHALPLRAGPRSTTPDTALCLGDPSGRRARL